MSQIYLGEADWHRWLLARGYSLDTENAYNGLDYLSPNGFRLSMSMAVFREINSDIEMSDKGYGVVYSKAAKKGLLSDSKT